jgi:hypothetical protein
MRRGLDLPSAHINATRTRGDECAYERFADAAIPARDERYRVCDFHGLDS